MKDNDKSLEERQKEKEAEYDEQIAQARIGLALMRYQRLHSGQSNQQTEPNDR